MKNSYLKRISAMLLTVCLTLSIIPLGIFTFDASAADPDLITVVDFEDYSIGPWSGFATRGANYPNVSIVADPSSPGQKSLQVSVSDWNQAPIVPVHLPYALSNYASISVKLRAVSGNVGTNGLQIFASSSDAEAGNFIRYGFGNENNAVHHFTNRRIAAFAPTTLNTSSWTTVTFNNPTVNAATQDLQGTVYLAIGINTNATASYLIDDITFTLKDGVLPANPGAAVGAPALNSAAQKSIVINAVTPPGNGQTVEYGIRTVNSPPSVWQDGLTFGNLNPNTDYYIFTRSKANATHRAGTPSASLQVRTPALSAPVPVSAGQGAAETGIYRNMFLEAGYSQEEIDARVKRTYDRLFNGADGGGYNIYIPVGTDMAYIHAVDSNDVRSEGMSYGMMMALQMDDQERFDRLWNWSHTYMLNKTGEARGYFAWRCGTSGNQMDTNPAPDGEMYFATALLFASNRWGDKDGIYEYGREARIILYDMINRRAGERKALFNLDNKLPEFSPMTSFTDASYHLSAFFEIWAEEIIHGEQYWDIWNDDIGAVMRDAEFYRESAAVCRDWLMTVGTHSVTGLSSEYAQYDGTPGGGGGVGNSHLFSYDSWRTAMNIALDHSWWAKDPRQTAHANRIQAFFIHPDRNPDGIFSYGNKWYVNGNPVQNDGHSAGLVAGNAAASLAASDPQAWDFIDHFWNIGQDNGTYRYYGGCLYMFAMLKLSGNYKAYYSTGPGTGTEKNSRVVASSTTFDKANPTGIPLNVTWNGNTLTGITGNGVSLVSGTHYTTASNTITLNSTYLAAQATYSTVRLEFTFSEGAKRTLSIYIDDTSKSILGHTFEERVSLQYTPGPQSGSQTLVANYRGNDLLHVVKSGGHSNHAVIFPFRLADGALNTYNTLYVRLRPISGFSGGRIIRAEAGSADTKFAQLGSNALIGGLNQNFSDGTSFIDLEIPLSGQPAISGDIKIAFGLMNAADHAYELEYIGLVPRGTAIVPSSNINRTTANFDRANPAAIPVIMTLNGNTFQGINRGGTALVPNTDYTVSGNNVSINASYLNTLPTGTTNLTFTFNAGASRTLAVTVMASNPTISPTSATFDKSGSANLTVNITPNGNNTLTAVRNGTAVLTAGTDYTVSGNTVTLNNAYLKTLAFGTSVTLTFEFSPGANQSFTVNVEDSSIQNAVLNTNSGAFDKFEPNDINIIMTLNGNTLQGINHGALTLSEGNQFIRSSDTITLKESYLLTLPIGANTLTFEFAPGINRTFTVNVTDSTPVVGTPAKLSYDFSKDDITALIEFNTNKNAGTSAEIKSGVLEVTAAARGDLVVIPFDLGPLSLNDIQSVRIRVRSTAGDTNYKDFGVAASATGIYSTGMTGFTPIASQGNGLSIANNWGTFTMPVTPGTAAGLNGTVKLGFGITEQHGSVTYQISEIELIPKPGAIPNAVLTPSGAAFDTENPDDITISAAWNGNALTAVKNGTATLTPNVHYTVSGNEITIREGYLTNLPNGKTTLTFEFSPGQNRTFDINVSAGGGSFSDLVLRHTFDGNKTLNEGDVKATPIHNSNTTSWQFLTNGNSEEVMRVTRINTNNSSNGVILPFNLGDTTLGDYTHFKIGIRPVSGDVTNKDLFVEVRPDGQDFTALGSANNTTVRLVNAANSGLAIGTLKHFDLPITNTNSTLSGEINIAFGLNNATAHAYDIVYAELHPPPPCAHIFIWGGFDTANHWEVCMKCSFKENETHTLVYESGGNMHWQACSNTNCDYKTASADCSALPPSVPYALFGTPTLGLNDSIWENAAELQVNNSNNVNATARGIARVLWDDSFLYVRVEVTDPDVYTGTPPNNHHNYDGVEIFVGAGSSGSNQYRLNPSGARSGQTPNDSWAGITGTGYIVEYKVAKGSLNFAPDAPLTFEVQINDSNSTGGTRLGCISWYATPDTAWGGSTAFTDSLLLWKPNAETSDVWLTDSFEHWKVCAACGNDFNKVSHTWTDGAGADDTNHICACGVTAAHNYGGYTTTVEATCIDFGSRTKTCQEASCGRVETSPHPAYAAHSWGDGWYVSSDQTSVPEGQERLERECVTCSHVEHNIVNKCPGVTHDFSEGEVTKPATCAEDGEQRFYCVHSGLGCAEYVTNQIFRSTVPCTSNNAQDSNCLSANECTICFIELTAAGSHDYEWETTKNATCSEEGLETEKCTKCGDIKGTKPITETPHTFNADSQKTETHHECTDCTHKEPHSFNSETGICTVCAYSSYVECLSHDWGTGWTPETGKLCGDTENETRTCVVCSRVENKPGALIAHDFGTSKNDGTHECKRDGCTEIETCSPNTANSTCTKCGYTTKGSGGGGGGGGGGGSTPADDRPANIVQIGTEGTIPPSFTIPSTTVNNIAGSLPFARLRIFNTGSQSVSFGVENAGKNAILIRRNSETGELEVVSAVVIGADGIARKNIPAVGDYLVIVRKTGDITATGEVQTADALALLRHIAGINELNAVQLFVANGKEGDVSTTDALNILRYVAGIINKI
ncbi:MAG: glycosyl hydrolase family 8 [Oscillospiraceae bacterium]|nr:glycosyl hydrolase family 8 [Oscillospiraceae bacterium]